MSRLDWLRWDWTDDDTLASPIELASDWTTQTGAGHTESTAQSVERCQDNGCWAAC